MTCGQKVFGRVFLLTGIMGWSCKITGWSVTADVSFTAGHTGVENHVTSGLVE